MVEIGKLNRLKIIKELNFGVYLDGNELGEILLPLKYLPQDRNIGDIIEVFIYLDSEDYLIATTQKPYVMVGQFALLKAVSVNSVGAFLDWGLLKDLLVPFSEQKHKMEEGESYVVYVYLDNKSQRIAASSKLDKFLDILPHNFHKDEEVNLLIWEQTDIGYKAIINGSHQGVIFANDIFRKLKQGQQIKGFIKKIRDDKKIDLSLHKPGFEQTEDLSEKIIENLKQHNGFIPITNKSTPETIYDLFGVSKKTYKKAIGNLYKKGLITIVANGINLKFANGSN